MGDYGAHTLQRDVALVRVDAVRSKPLKLTNKPPQIGTDAVVIGAPKGLDFSLSRGIVSQVRENGDFIQVDAPVNPGNSGGSLFDSEGCMIGVVTFKKEDSEGLNFAIGYKPVSHFLDNIAIERKPKTKTKFVAYVPPIDRGPDDGLRQPGPNWSHTLSSVKVNEDSSKNYFDR